MPMEAVVRHGLREAQAETVAGENQWRVIGETLKYIAWGVGKKDQRGSARFMKMKPESHILTF